MKHKKTDHLEAISERNLKRFGTAIVTLCSVILIFRLVSSYFPEERLWGINHLAYFSGQFAAAITFLGLLLFVPAINRRVLNIMEKALEFFHRFGIGKHTYFWFVILSLACLALFVTLRNTTHFLGDGTWLVTLITAENPQIGWSEPLEYAVHILVYRLAGQFFAITGLGAYEMVACMAGVLFAFFAFLLADASGENRITKTFIFLIIATMGGAELFFGYAEHYALSYVFILAFIVFGIKYLSGKSNPLVPGLFFALSVFSHFSSLYLLPALVFLYLSGNSDSKTRHDRPKLWKYRIIVVAVLVIGGVFWYITRSIRSTGFLRSPWEIFVPLFQAKPDAPGYTLFSLRHLLDVLNEQLLLSPIGAALLLTLLVFVAKKSILKNRVVQFLVIVSVFQLMYGFVLDPILGAAGDWDLFSATALGYTVLAIYLFPRLVRNAQRVRYIGSVLVVTSVLSTAPWILLNANTERSIARTRVLTDLDPKRSKGARTALWGYFEDHGMNEEASKERVRMMEGMPELVYYNLGLDYAALGHLDSAVAALQKAIQIEEFFAEAHYELGACYSKLGKPEQAILQFQKALSSRPKNKVATDCYAWLGNIYSQREHFGKAKEMYLKAAQGTPRDLGGVYQNLGHCYLVEGELDEAISTYRKAIKSNPDLIEPHMYIGHAYLKKGARAKAIEEYELFLKHATDAEQIERIKVLMSKLNQQ